MIVKIASNDFVFPGIAAIGKEEFYHHHGKSYSGHLFSFLLALISSSSGAVYEAVLVVKAANEIAYTLYNFIVEIGQP